MKYKRFEELPVWRAAIELTLKTYDFTDKLSFRGRAGLRNQLERAVLSISNNIAEGFERGTTKELLTFLYIARGSAGRCDPCCVRWNTSLLRTISNLRFQI